MRPARCRLARSISLMRVCQPSPVARSAASTSASKRSFTGSLVVAWVLPWGRPRLRAAGCSCSGVVMRANWPAWAWRMDWATSWAKASISRSMVLVSGIEGLLPHFQNIGGQIVELGFGIGCDQDNFTAGQAVEVNDPGASTLAYALTFPAHFAQRGNAWNAVPCLGVGGYEELEFVQFFITKHTLRHPKEYGGFNNSK